MNELVKGTGLAISTGSAELIQSRIIKSTLKRYQEIIEAD